MVERVDSEDAQIRPWICGEHGVAVYEGRCPDCEADEFFVLPGLKRAWLYFTGGTGGGSDDGR